MTYPYYRDEIQNISLYGSKDLIIKNANNFCLDNFYTIRYNTFLHIFLYSITYQKLVFYAGIPFNIIFIT